jgi:DNA polymerase-3 subunit epsilon
MGRCLSPCLGDLDPNLYRRRLDEALRLFVDGGDGRDRLTAHVERQMRGAASQQLFERAAWLRRRARRLRVILDRLGGVLEATHARPRLVLAPHPLGGSFDAFWVVGGRLVDWGPVGDGDCELSRRTEAALARGGGRGGPGVGTHLPPDEVDEMRIVAAYLASHPDTPQLVLDPAPAATDLAGFVSDAADRPAQFVRDIAVETASVEAAAS